MITYECETCKCTAEIEEVEAVLYSHNHEHYELNLCMNCYDKL